MPTGIWKNKTFWQAVATFVGTIIGAGILGIPFVVAKVGWWPGLAYLVLLGFAALLVNLMTMEIMLRTKYKHQLVGLMKKYLGNWAKHVQAAAMLIGMYGALVAYTIGEGEVLHSLMPNIGLSSFAFSILFFIVGTIILLIGLKVIKVFESWLVFFIMIITLVIAGFSIPFIDLSNFQPIDLSQSFMPYGVILFAYGGMSIIFSLREIMRGQEELIRPAMIVGGIIPIILYTIFAFVVLGVTGTSTTEVATVGLGEAIGPAMVFFSNIFAVLVMATSFFAVGIALRQVYHYDYKHPVWLAWLLTVSVPLLIFIFLSRDFIKVIGIAGSITFGLSGALIVLAFWKARKQGDIKPAFVLPPLKIIGSILIGLFIFGIIYTIITL